MPERVTSPNRQFLTPDAADLFAYFKHHLGQILALSRRSFHP
jgi:hypothetical protein